MASKDTIVVTVRRIWSSETQKSMSQNAPIKKQVWTISDIGDPIHRVAEKANHSTFLLRDADILVFIIFLNFITWREYREIHFFSKIYTCFFVAIDWFFTDTLYTSIVVNLIYDTKEDMASSTHR